MKSSFSQTTQASQNFIFSRSGKIPFASENPNDGRTIHEEAPSYDLEVQFRQFTRLSLI